MRQNGLVVLSENAMHSDPLTVKYLKATLKVLLFRRKRMIFEVSL